MFCSSNFSLFTDAPLTSEKPSKILIISQF
uniref:Uncharacterized protein n=1 Tax=Arundo donax TaxID=35708 RepID=A0A0A9BXL3_ARUDO